MRNDDLIAALEWAVGQAQGCQADEVFVLGQLLADLRAGNLVRREDVVAEAQLSMAAHRGAARERAKVVAYIQSLSNGLLAMLPNTQRRLTDAIAAGAHEGGGDA